MLKYGLLFVLNLPFIILALMRTLHGFTTGRITRLRLVLSFTFWILVAVGLALAKPVFEYLETNELTNSTPLSLYDVATITAAVFSIFMIFRIYSKFDQLEQRVNQLNREASIALSNKSTDE